MGDLREGRDKNEGSGEGGEIEEWSSKKDNWRWGEAHFKSEVV